MQRNPSFVRGAALPEYALVLLVATIAVAGMAAGGYSMLDNYRAMSAKIRATGP